MENQSSTTSSSMQFLILEQVQFLKVNDESLLQWELVDVVDAEEEEEMVDDVDGESFVSWAVSSPIGDSVEGINHGLLHLDDGFSEEQVKVNHDVGDDDDEDDDDEDDLDDELVPWDIGNKLGRQRMRKLGKRVSSKMNNSKRSPYLFVSPGCVRGKHGMGLKHCF
ncbi:nuclear polyadenylated RNA-binding protein 3-like [Vicia villosa]|uniref:nuclear polyadenylated RNA-binding protein 3-like n=1 Tax=Vicia villosa TaxID=3911 RepID=UPI00273A7DDB|nr:nuclear polyadenylated RNA-binding protein 3-like [Vicia villosa]